MTKFRSLGLEQLVKEDGKVSATILPFDKVNADTAFETATFGMGWFWGPDSEFGSLPGVLRTRAGYCGGEKEKPTYRSMGDHTEAVSIDYDPTVVSYQDLIKEFWAGHRCNSLNRSTQYMNAVFYRDEAQYQAALESLDREAHRLGISPTEIATQVVPVNHFTYAEGYHQKYSLSRTSESRIFLESIYPSAKELADSTVATRLNAYLGSGMKKDWAIFAEELPNYGLPETLEKRLLENALSRV